MALRIIKKIGSLLLVLLIGISFSGCVIENGILNQITPGESENPQVNYLYLVLNNYYYLDLPLNLTKIDDVEELLKYTDPYTSISKDGTSPLQKGDSYVGIGLTLQENSQGLLVTEVNYEIDLETTVYVGDLILKVNGIELKGLEFADKTELLRGDLGEQKVVELKRFSEIITVTLELVEVPFKSVVAYNFGGIGLIQINRFAEKTAEYFETALELLESLEIEALIIDVRNNGGGYLVAVLEILQNFVYGEEPFFYKHNVKKEIITEYVPNEGNTPKDYPIMVLTNQNSASASEVLAGSLQQFGYEIFGETTYGKDLYQSGVYLPEAIFGEGMIFMFTEGYWFLKDEYHVSAGLVPDVKFYESGIKAIPYPRLIEEYEKGDSNAYIFVYQYIISQFVDKSYNLGYFDESFEEMVKDYQALKEIPVTGRLDELTLKVLTVEYRSLMRNKDNDFLLKEALLYMQGKINAD